jgi:hypothetical protein
MSLVYRSESSGSIFLGGKSDAKDLAFLLAKNITHILNVTPPKEAGVQVGHICSIDRFVLGHCTLPCISTHSPREMGFLDHLTFIFYFRPEFPISSNRVTNLSTNELKCTTRPLRIYYRTRTELSSSFPLVSATEVSWYIANKECPVQRHASRSI